MASFNKKNTKSGPNQNDGPSTASSPDSSANLSNNSTQGNNNNAPKYGTLVPNRVFVGGISSTTTESELCQLFSKYGNVKDTKIIADRAGVSKGYGFVTFESEEEAKLLQRDADNIILKERKLNIAPAIKKQPFNRAFEATSSPPPPVPANLFFPNGVSYTYHNGMAFFGPSAQQPVPPIAPAHPTAEPAQIFQGYGPTQNPPAPFTPMMFSCNPQPLYIPAQQFHPYQPMPVDYFQQINNGGTTAAAYLYNGGGPQNSDRNSPMAASETSSTPHMPSLPPPPPPPQFFPTQFQPNEMCYSAIPQAVYPLFAVNTMDNTVYSSAGCEVTDPPSSNISAEDSSSIESNQSETLPLEVQSVSASDIKSNDSIAQPNRCDAMETPVVSLLSIQQNGEGRELRNMRNTRRGRRQGPTGPSRSRDNFHIPPPPPQMMLCPPLYSNPSPNMFYNSLFPRIQNPVNYSQRPGSFPRNGFGSGRGRGGNNRGRYSRPNDQNVLDSKLPFNNNNTSVSNNNFCQSKLESTNRSRLSTTNRGRGGGRRSAQPSPSPPPAPYSPMVRSAVFTGSNQSLCSSPPPQVSPQFQQSRQYYNPGYQFQNPQVHTTPLNPKRYNNSGKKQTGNLNGAASNGNFGRGKYRNTQGSTNAVDKSALGGAGDAPPMVHGELTPPYTPGSSTNSNSTTATQAADTIPSDLSVKVQGLTL